MIALLLTKDRFIYAVFTITILQALITTAEGNPP
jgi:hypothetical protein